jgi:hypothetical protein
MAGAALDAIWNVEADRHMRKPSHMEIDRVTQDRRTHWHSGGRLTTEGQRTVASVHDSVT